MQTLLYELKIIIEIYIIGDRKCIIYYLIIKQKLSLEKNINIMYLDGILKYDKKYINPLNKWRYDSEKKVTIK